MKPPGNGLESDHYGSNTDSGIELNYAAPEYIKFPNPKDSNLSIAYNKTAFMVTCLAVLVIAIVGIGAYGLSRIASKNTHSGAQNIDQLAANYAPGNLSVQNLKNNNQLSLGTTEHLEINGQLEVNKTLVLAPTSAPASPTVGEIYYDQATNQPYYYNGSQFVGLATSLQSVLSVGGSSGAIVLGNGLQVAGNQLSLSNTVLQTLASSNLNGPIVTSIQGLTGSVILTGSANQAVVSTASGNINISLPQDIGTSSDVQFGSLELSTGNLTLTPSAIINSDNISTVNNGDTMLISGSNNINFENQNGANSFTFPTSGGPGQVLCTTVNVCASGGGSYVILEPAGVQTTSANKNSIFVNKAGGTGNLIELQTSGVDALVINNIGDTTISNLTVSNSLSTNSITPTGAFTVGSSTQPITLQGNSQTELTATSGTFTNTVNFITPTANRTISFPDLSGTVCLTIGNCLGGSGGANTSLSNLNSVAINTSLLPQNAGTINLGSPTLPFGQLYVAGSSGTPGINNFLITGSSTSGTRTITLPDNNGTVCLQNSASCGFVTTGSDVAQLDGLNGALSIANSTPAGSTITINDASTLAKGISEFNATNFSVVNGVVNTIQNINTGASPNFNSLKLGTATISNGVLQLANSTNTNLLAIQGLAPSGAGGTATVDIPTIAGGSTDTVCLLTLANCVGTGGGATTTGGTQNYVSKYNNVGGTQITSSEIYDNGSGVAIGSTTVTGLFNVGTASQFNVSNTGAITAVGVNSGTGLIQGTGGLTVSGGAGASISGGLNNNNGNITNAGSIGGVAGYTQTSGTSSITSTTTSGNIASVVDTALNANNAALNQLTFTNANGTGTATTVNGLSISPAGTASGNNVINAINLSNVSTIAGNQFNGLYFGTGYSNLLNYNGASLINGTGILQSAAVSGTYSNLTGTGALTTGSIGSGFGSISTTNSIATTSSLQGGTLNVAGGDLTVDGSGNLSTTGTGVFQGGLTVGNAGSATGNLYLANGTNGRLVDLVGLSPSGAGNATIQFPTIAGGATDTVCLLNIANCAGAGGGATTTGGTQNYVSKYNNVGGTQITSSEIYDNGSGVAIGSTTVTGLFNVGTASQFNVSNTGAITAVGVNSGTGLIQGTGGINITGSYTQTGSSLNTFTGDSTFSGGSTGLSVTNNASVGGILTIQGSSLTIGNAGATTGALNIANISGSNLDILQGQYASGAGNATYTLPSIAGGTSDIVCLKNLNNCSAGGGAGSYIDNQITTQSGANFNITGIGSSVTAVIQGATGGGNITNFIDNGGNEVAAVGSEGTLTLGKPGSIDATLQLANSTNTNLLAIQGLAPSGAGGTATVDIPTIAGGSTDTVCLLTLANCVGTGGGATTTGGTQNYVSKYNNVGGTQITSSEIYDNGSGVAIGSTTVTGLFNVGTASQFNVSNTGAITAVGVNSGTGLIQGTGGLTVSGGAGASISGGLNNNNGNITNAGSIGGVAGYTQTSGTSSITSTTTSGNIASVVDTALNANNAALNQLTFTNANGTGTATTVNGLSISPAGTASGNNVINAINLSNVSTIAGNQFNGLYFGTGYSNLLNYNGASLINGTGILQSAAVSGTYSNLTGTGALTTGSIGSGFGSISTTNSIATTSSLQGGTLNVAGGDLTVDGSGNLSTTGTGVFQGGLTVGNAGSATGNLYLANGTNGRLVDLVGLSPSGAGNATIQFPTIAGGATDTVCLLNIANCAGAGGGATTTGGTQNYVSKYNNVGGTQITSSEIYDNGSGVAIGSTTVTGLFNVGTASQFNVSNTGAITAVGVNSGTGLIQGTGGLTVSGGAGASISGGLNNNNGNITNAGSIGGVAGYTQTSGTSSITSTTTSGNIASVVDTALNANNAALNQLTFTNANGTGTATTVNGLSISPAGTASGNNVINAINLSNVSTIAGNQFNGLYFGTGYSNLLNYNGASLINGTGILQSAAVSGTYSNLTGTGALTTGSIGSGFGSISTTNSIATTSSLQGGTLNVAGGDLTVDGSGNLSTTGTGVFQGGLTVGNAGSATGNLYLANGTNGRLVDLVGLSPSGAGNATIQFPTIAGGATDTVCLLNIANCAGAGGGATTTGGTQNYVSKYNNVGGTQITSSEIYDNGSGVAIGSTTVTGLFNVGTASQFNVSNTGAITAVGVNSGTGLIQGTGGLTVSGGAGASISGGLNNNNGNITNAGSIGGVAGYTQTSGTSSITSTTTSGNIASVVDTALNANNAALNQLTFTNANGTGTATTVNGLSISPAGTASGNNVINAINLSNVSTIAGNQFNGLYFGTGYSNLLNYNGASLINGTGILQSAAVSGTYSNLTGTGALTTGSIGSGFGSISTTNSIATTSSLQGGTLNVAGGDLTVDGSGNLSTTGTGVFQGGLTVGNAGSATGNLYLANGTNGRLVDLVGLSPSGAGNATIQFPTIAGGATDTVCLLNIANCAGAGGGATTTGGTQNYVSKYNNVGGTQITSSEIYDNGSGVAIGSTTVTGLFNVGTASQFNVSNTGAITAVGVNSGTGLIQGTGGLTVSGGAGASISGGLNNNNGNITNAGSIGGVAGYTQTSGTSSITSTTTSGNIASVVDTALNANNAALNQLTFTNANGTGTATTVNGLSISPAGTASGNNVINAINLSNVSTIAGNQFNGLYFGTGYSNLLNYNGASLINGTGILQSAAVSGTYSNLTGTGALTTGSIGSGFGSISTTNSIATTSSLQGGSLSLAGGDLTVDTSGDLISNGTGEFYSGLTLGGAGSAIGNLYFGNTTNTNLLDVQGLAPSGSGNATIDLPTIIGGNTDTVCLLTLANCVGRGGGLSTSGGSQNYITKYSNLAATQLSNSLLYDNGSGVAVGGTTVTGLFNVGASSQFNVNSSGAVTAVGVNSGTGLIQGSGGLTVSSGSVSQSVSSSGVMISTSTNSSTTYQIQNSDGESILQAGTLSPNNYIADADFALGSGSSLTDWTQVGSPSIFSQNTTTTNTYEGATSLEVILGGTSGEGFQTPGSGVGLTSSPVTNNTVNEYYTVSFEALSSVFIPGNTFTITAVDSTGNQSCTGLIDGSGSNTLTNSGFVQVYCTLQFTSGSTGSISQIQVSTSISSGVIYYDAVQLQLATSSSTSATPSAFQEGSLQFRGVITSPVVLENVTNSETAFQIQNTSGMELFDVDTLDNKVNLGSNTGLYLQGTSAFISNSQGYSHSESYGLDASATSTDATAIGFSANAYTDSVAIGSSANNGSNPDSIAIGSSAVDTAQYQLVIGSTTSNNAYIQNAYIGSGVTDSTPKSITLNATGGNGSNVTGANINIAGGIGTGTGNSGNIGFEIAKPSVTSGSTANSLASVATISGVNGASTFENSANSTSAFQIQNSSGYNVLDVDTSSNLVNLGTSNHVNGSLVFNNSSNSNTITLNTGASSASYTLTLPTTSPSTNQCLETDSSTATQIDFVSCGSGTSLQGAYNSSAGASPDILLTSGDLGFTVQNANSSGLSSSSELFGVHANASSGLGSSLFSVTGNGDTSITSSDTSGNAFSITGNSITTGNGVNDTFNGLTSGNGISIATTSAIQSGSGSLINVSDTATLTTNSGTETGNLLNVSRSLTSNIAGASNATPTLDTSATYQEDSGMGGSWTTGSFTVGTNSNRFLFVAITDKGGVGSGTALGYPTAVSYNGTSMYEIGSPIDTSTPGLTSTTITYWGLIAPSTGSNTFTVTGNTHDNNTIDYNMLADSWYNVYQSQPFGSFSSNNGSSGNASLTASSANGRVVVDGVGSYDGSGAAPTLTKGAGQTLTSSNADNTSHLSVGSSYKAATSSTTSMSWTVGTNTGWAEGAIDLIGVPSSAETVSTSVATFSNNCTENTGSVCTDATNVINVNQQYTASTGAAVEIQNSGQGFGLQIQNGSSSNALTVATSGVTSIDTTTSQVNATLTIGETGTASIAAEGSVSSNLGDYAEYFPQASPGQLQPGDVACLNSLGLVEQCTAGNSTDSLIGVVSTSPGFVGNNKIYDATHPQNYALISMMGQVPVKVSTLNGPINVGDMLTLSPIDGVAAKNINPSEVIGTALESYSGQGSGIIQVYIHIQFSDPIANGLQSSNGSYAQNGYSANFSSLNVSGNTTTQNLIVTGTATIETLTVDNLTSTGSITIDGHIITGGNSPVIVNKLTACSDATLSIKGTDTAGIITLTTNSSCTVNDSMIGINFSNSYASNPNISLTPANANSSKLQTYIDSSSSTNTGFVISTTSNSLSSNTTYQWYYQVIQ